jgi:hypothetical protein
MTDSVEKWGCFEANFHGPREGNPFSDVSLSAVFTQGESRVEVNGFYDGEGVFKVRFMPERSGRWTFRTRSDSKILDGLEGSFLCAGESQGNHGPVRLRNRFHFEYADGKPYYPFGTTCYAWIHQSEELQERTLKTLAASPFNKLRMCVFPKHYDYNHNEPALYPFRGSIGAGFDFTRPNPDFFRHLEKRILDLQALGIECDLILFHPYDRWGFSDMGPENDRAYLKYVAARLAAMRNVWWSMANEYDLFLRPDGSLKKDVEEWDRLGRALRECDPFGRLRSIHNCLKIYDHEKDWISHCSIQRTDHVKTAENVNEWRGRYGKPIVIDECAYEGNINHGWGNITGQEMTRRFWEGVVRGGYVGHGETYTHPQDILWWSHGGELHGTSPARIAFLRAILESAPAPIEPVQKPAGALFDPNWDAPCGAVGEEFYIFYFSFCQPSFRTFSMPAGKFYCVDIIDSWEMHITEVPGEFSGAFRIDLPGKPFIAVRMTSLISRS